MRTDPCVDRLSHGVSVIDTGFQRPRFDAAFLVVEHGQAAFVDTGTNHSVPRLLAALQAHDLDVADVRWVIVTHVHLDHAGGAGLLLQHLPNARLVVHARGARHLVDPAQLMAGVRAVYGEETVQRDYGELVAVAPERIVPTEEGLVLDLAGRPLRFLDTPGHARHHHCIWDEASRGCFVGDTLGVSYEELRRPDVHYAFPSTTPVQFDPPALERSIGRLIGLQPRAAYITHYGAVEHVETQAELVLKQMAEMVSLVREEPKPDSHDVRRRLEEIYCTQARACGLNLARSEFSRLVASDVELNAQGLEVWCRNSNST